MTGLRKYPPAIDSPEWNDLIDYLGGISILAQIDTTKIVLNGASPAALLSSWQDASDKSKIDATKLALSNGLAVAAGTNTIVATAGYTDLPTYPISITLPVAGTYLIFYSLSATVYGGTSPQLYVEFRNVTDTADIADTQRQLYCGTSGFQAFLSLSATSIITVAASKNIRVYAYRTGTGGTVAIYGIATVASNAGYVRIA